MKSVNYIIVGQGLAGTVLAQTLLNKGCSVCIVDDQKLSKASRIAAGLYNPVVFKRLVKSWLADDLIPFMDKFYNDAEEFLNTKFYYKKQIVRFFAEEQEKELWIKKTEEPVGKFLRKKITNDYQDVCFNPLGASEVIDSGNLDTAHFLLSFRKYFLSHEILLAEKFEYDKICFQNNKVEYKKIVADKIIFCEGFQAIHNPFFSWLHFKLTKGEIITIKFDPAFLIPTEKVINKAVFILPIGNNSYKVGATYEWNELNEENTEKGLSELTEKLQKVLKIPFEIIDHQAGIRPTVNDRRPLLGIHPEHPELAVFNGMGTKGVMLSPYFASHFVDHLLNDIPLNNEVNIARFK